MNVSACYKKLRHWNFNLSVIFVTLPLLLMVWTRVAHSEACPPAPAAILVHGLNNTAKIMLPWGERLRSAGIYPIPITLAGHLPHDDISTASREEWIANIDTAYRDFRRCHPTAPLFGVGYSLGGLVLTSFLDRHPDTELSALFLIAPAIRLTTRAKALFLLSPLKYFNVSLPTLAPHYLRAHDRMPLLTYGEVGALVDETRLLTRESIGAIPTRIFMAPSDELVSRMRLSAWIELNHLDQWALLSFVPEYRTESPYFHLAADVHSLTDDSFQQASAAMIDHFRQSSSIK